MYDSSPAPFTDAQGDVIGRPYLPCSALPWGLHASHPATTPDRFAAYNEATSWEPRYVGLISNDDDGGVPACRALISTSGTGVCGEIMSMSMYISRYKGGDLCPDLGTNVSFSSPNPYPPLSGETSYGLLMSSAGARYLVGMLLTNN